MGFLNTVIVYRNPLSYFPKKYLKINTYRLSKGLYLIVHLYLIVNNYDL